MIPLYAHQKAIIDADPKKCLLALGTGSGKTRTTLELARGKTLVICPKQQALDNTWQDNAKKAGIEIDLTVISKEKFKSEYTKLNGFQTVIIDECHYFTGVYPEVKQKNGIQIPKTSQLFDTLLCFLDENKPERLYFLSATPASKPLHIFALGVLLGKW
jgi:hypothetical protein